MAARHEFAPVWGRPTPFYELASRATDYMPGKPFGFSEIAWPSLDAFGGEQGQASFIEQVAGRLTLDREVNLHMFG